MAFEWLLMPPAHPFHVFGTSHQAVLVLTPLMIVLLALLRRWHEGLAVRAERLLAVLLFLTWPVTMIGHWLGGDFSRDNAYPCHFCDVAAMCGSVALWARSRLFCEILYFFGMAGTLQGLLTPNLKADFPDLRFFAFFLLHSGVVVAALHAVTSMRCPPRPGAVPRMAGITFLYGLLAGLLNALAGTNYGFLCSKPEVASLMDHLGPWPWYIAGLVLLTVVFYTVLNLPFVMARWWRSRRR